MEDLRTNTNANDRVPHPYRFPKAKSPLPGQSWLVEERDACGVGFIADPSGRPSHRLLGQAINALGCLEHRGACSADRDSGDGAGITSAIPWKMFRPWFEAQQLEMPSTDKGAVGMVFLPADAGQAQIARDAVRDVLEAENFRVLGWREVPVRPEVLGDLAAAHQPQIEQVFVQSDRHRGSDLEKALYIARAHINKRVARGLNNPQEFYICSFSSRTIVYKGMVRSAVLGTFYPDLQNPDYETPFAVYHRRFSTNTMPKWPLAQPMRLLGHNGEINTVLGNINWMAAREGDLAAADWTAAELDAIIPVVDPERSDSSNLDSVMELLVRSGRSPLEALMMLVPEAYRQQPDLEPYPEITDFYKFYSGLQEPWDGPALIVFSDGKTVGAALDRNGLRPARYSITKEGYVVVGSEAGVVDRKSVV